LFFCCTDGSQLTELSAGCW